MMIRIIAFIRVENRAVILVAPVPSRGKESIPPLVSLGVTGYNRKVKGINPLTYRLPNQFDNLGVAKHIRPAQAKLSP